MAADDTYLDFEIGIWEEAGVYHARVRSPAGESGVAALPDIIGSPDRAANLRLTLENSIGRSGRRLRGVPTRAERYLEEFGRAIFDGLLGEDRPFAPLFRESLELAAAREPDVKGVRVVLNVESPELSRLPWEYLYNAASHDWLSLNYHSPIVRFLVADRPARALEVDGPLNVLGMIANPGGHWQRIDADAERNRIEQAVKKLQRERRINFVWAPKGTLAQLRKMVEQARGPWHVFHFIGHGGVPEPDEAHGDDEREGYLVFADENGGAQEVSARDLCLQLQGYRHGMPQLVVLNSCEGACAGRSGRVRSPAAALIHAGVPAVVAMQFRISDESAIQFGATFYRALVDNLPLEAALTCARKGIHAHCPVEWGIPVLYTRARGGTLFAGPRQTADRPAPPRVAMQPPPAQDARSRLRALLSRPQSGGQ